MNQEDYNYWNTPKGFWILLKSNFELFEKCKYFMLDNFVQKHNIIIKRERLASGYEGYLLYCFSLMMEAIEKNGIYRLRNNNIEFYFKNSFVFKLKNYYNYFDRITLNDREINNLKLSDKDDQKETELQNVRVKLVEKTFEEMKSNNNLRECPEYLQKRFFEENKIIDIFKNRIFGFSLKTLGRYEKKCKPAFKLIYNKLKEKYG